MLNLSVRTVDVDGRLNGDLLSGIEGQLRVGLGEERFLQFLCARHVDGLILPHRALIGCVACSILRRGRGLNSRRAVSRASS